MKNELQNHYDEIKRVLEILPTNTKSNKKKKEDYLEQELAQNSENIVVVLDEIKSRLSSFNNLKENKEIIRNIENLKSFGSLTDYNDYTSAYEKMHLDCYLYELMVSSKEDLKTVNDCLKKIVKSFADTGIVLTGEDFNYNNYVSEYMSLIIDNKDDATLKSKFEEIYWKFPELITTTIINIQSIYIRNEKKLEKYYEDLTEKYRKAFKGVDVEGTVISLNREIKEKSHRDPYFIFNNFKNGTYSLANFKQPSVDSKINKYFDEGNYSYDSLVSLSKTLFEYYLIVKYNYLLNDIKERLEKKETFKGCKAKSLDKILSVEKKLVKLNKSNNKKHLFKRNDEKWLFKYNEVLKELINNYKAHENECFNDLIYNKLYSDSSILEALKLASSHYLYFVDQYSKNKSDNMVEINKEFNSLKDDVYNKEFFMINSIALLDRKHMKEIIIDKYKLEGVNLNIESLEEANIEKTMIDINDLIRYEDVKASKLSIDDIELYLEMDKITNRK